MLGAAGIRQSDRPESTCEDLMKLWENIELARLFSRCSRDLLVIIDYPENLMNVTLRNCISLVWDYPHSKV